MNMKQAVGSVFGKYVTFSGRAPRSEFWWFVLFVIIVSIVLAILDSMIFGVNAVTGEPRQVLSGIFQLAVFLPALAVGFRRMHDSGRPGWYYLAPFLIVVVLSLISVVGLAVAVKLGPEGLESGAGMMMGGVAVMLIGIAQLVLTVLMIYWLTRPSDPAENRYGPPVVGAAAPSAPE